MTDPSQTPFDLKFTDEEFVALHSAASAKGLHVNDFIVATLRQHARLVEEIEELQESQDGTPSETSS